MKKLLSIILCAAMLASMLCVVTPAANEQTVLFESISAVFSFSGADVSYDSYLNAVRISSDGASDADVTFDIGSLNGVANTYFAIWKNTGSDISITVGASDITVSSSHKFEAVKVSSSSNSTLHFSSGYAFVIYVFGISQNADTLCALANGSLNKYSESELVLNRYDVGKYTDYFWNSDIIYHESFFPIYEKDGTVAPIKLMYDIDRVACVQNNTLGTEFVYGIDYTIENGMLIINPDGNIPIIKYDAVYSDTPRSSSDRLTLSGDYAFCGQQYIYFTGYCNITYTPKNKWGGTIPEAKGHLLPHITQKLATKGSQIKILSIGDSLAGGANVSKANGYAPYCDEWCNMTADAIALKYPDVSVEKKTIAQGGATAALAIEKMAQILYYAPDVIFIEFGVNECMAGQDAWQKGGYVDTVKSAIASINKSLPNCDIVLISPTISNPIFFPTDWFYKYSDALYSLEREGVAVADATAMYQFALSQKRYIDMSGDFLCHPSDFATRLFVQANLRALEVENEAAYINGLADRILKYRYDGDFLEAELQEYKALASTASSKIAAAQTGEEARELYLAYAKNLDEIETAAEKAANASIDCECVTFTNQRSFDILKPSSPSNCAVKVDLDKKALAATVTYSRKPSYVLDYSVGDRALSADDYKYAVVTTATPAENSAKASTTKVSFIVNDETLESFSIANINDGKFHSHIIDLTQTEGFSGTVSGVNVNAFASCSVGDILYLSSITLCKDAESAEDIAIEKEITANGDNAMAVTYLMSDSETSSILKGTDFEGTPGFIYGDVNCDGFVNGKDILLMRRHLVCGDVIINDMAGDLDDSGDITVSDVIILRKTLAGILEERFDTESFAIVTFDNKEQAAKVALLNDNVTISANIADDNYLADTYKYVSVCAKSADGSALSITVTVTTDKGTATDTVTTESGEFFTADTARFTNLTGTIQSVAFTFNCDAPTLIYFDSFVLTHTISAAKSAETVRIGAANLQ